MVGLEALVSSAARWSSIQNGTYVMLAGQAKDEFLYMISQLASE